MNRRLFLPSRLLRTAAILVAIFLSFGVELLAGTQQTHDLLGGVGVAFHGLYGVEESTTLPGATGPTTRRYRWAKPESSIELWPGSPVASTLTIEYLNPNAPLQLTVRLATLGIGAAPAATFALVLPAAPTLRTLHLLVPPSAASSVRLLQPTPQTVGGRALGALFTAAHWRALAQSVGWVPGGSLGFGLPLTAGLVIALLFALGYTPLWGGVLPLIALPFALVTPWALRAAQPLLQGVLLGGLLAVLLVRRLPTRRWPLLLFGLWATSFLLLFSPIIHGDGTGYYAYLRSLAIDGDIQFANDFDPNESPLDYLPAQVSAPEAPDYIKNPWSVGPAIVWTPLWFVGHALTLGGKTLGLPWNAKGYDEPYIVMVGFTTALTGLLVLLGSYQVARRWFAPWVAGLSAVTIWLSSNLLYYALFDIAFSHSISAAATTWCLWATLRADDEPTSIRRWALVGFLAGMMLLIYWMTALLLLAPLLVALRHLLRLAWRGEWVNWRRVAFATLLAGMLAGLVFTPQLVAWRILYGNWFTIPQGTDFVTPKAPQVLPMLLGPLYGLAWWTPALFVGLIGSFYFAVRRPWPGGALLVAVLAYVLYNASLFDWHGSGGYGFRRLLPTVALITPGLAALFNRLGQRMALALIGIMTTMGLTTLTRYLTYDIPQDSTNILDLARYDLPAFLFTPTVPPLEQLAYVVFKSWPITALRAPWVGSTLSAGSILLMLVLIGMLVQWSERRGVRLAQTTAPPPPTSDRAG